MKILVIGGTKYFGRHLVNDLVANGHQVTVFSRGNVALNFNGDVKHFSGDRKNRNDLEKVRSFEAFDVIFDQVCINPSEAKLMTDVFNGFVKRFIFTSSQ